MVVERERCTYNTFPFYTFKVLMLQEIMPVMEGKGQVRKHQWSGKFTTLAFTKTEIKKKKFFFKNMGDIVTPK